MSRDNRFDRLESDIVDALRRAPGAAPSAELDARILARAHAAVAKPKRRPQPIWFSMAAGLVVLVGSGLALRIWQQLEHAPTALDVPAAKVLAPAPGVPAADTAAAGPSPQASGASAEERAPARQLEAPQLEAKSQDVAPATVVVTGAMTPQQAPAKPRETRSAEAAKLEGASGLVAAPPADDEMQDSPTPAAAPRPFPAEPEAVTAAAPSAAPMNAAAPAPSARPAAPPAAVATAPAAPPAPAAAADLGVIDLAKPGADQAADFTGASSEALLSGRDRAEEVDRPGAAAPAEVRIDAFATALEQLRRAIAAGDDAQARRLLAELRRQYPDRELPEDLRDWADLPR